MDDNWIERGFREAREQAEAFRAITRPRPESEVVPLPGFEHWGQSIEPDPQDVNPGLARAALVVTMERLLYELVPDRDVRRMLLMQLTLIEREYFFKLDRLTDGEADRDG